MAKKILFTLVLAFIGLTSFSQKGQRIAFVDMNYILENIPDYKKAQDQLNKKVQIWQRNLDKINSEIETLKTDLSNEKALLTEDLIAEKEEDIAIKEIEFQKLEELYFSSDGNLFLLRRQLVTPIQDQVYNAAQEIAKVRRYDFVFDKSSDLIMLYSNKQHDISELVLSSIVRGEKISKINEKRDSRNNQTTPVVLNDPNNEESTTKQQSDIIDPAKQDKIDEREAKRQAALDRIEKQKIDRAKKREEQKAAIEKKRLERLKKREDAKNELKKNKEKKEDSDNEKEDEKKENNN